MAQWVRRYIPSAFTLGNLYLGVLAIYLAMTGEWRLASFVVIVGMFLDGVDGRLARLLDVTSSFGKELDALADVVTFGVAPVTLMLALLSEYYLAHVAGAAFVFAGAIRLARFNSQPAVRPGAFTGLPITAAGGIAATATLYYQLLPDFFLPLTFLTLAVLMVSRVPYPDFKTVSLPRSAGMLAAFMVATVLMLWFARRFVFIPLVLYALMGFGWHGMLWRRLPHAWRIKYERGKAAAIRKREEQRAKRKG
ncbi:MAG: CDP-diacylglycerol--serine O-phosphatidyltransferase [Selenomonadales bacterium]|nr:CDP-diacylglycerol--serine O-phosphatidyltransferase [Selenomonadales bacterium]